MCVVFVCFSDRPKESVFRQAEYTNDHGIGIAWPEQQKKDVNAPPKVKWLKGIPKVQNLLEELKKIKGPCMIHFRNATAGGKSPYLTHPFPITERAELDLEGTADAVLMHNGTWKEWKDWMLRCAGTRKLPRYPISDSRALAWLGYSMGYGLYDVLDLYDRIAVLDPRTERVFNTWGSWSQKDGYWQSTDLFGGKGSSYSPTTTPLLPAHSSSTKGGSKKSSSTSTLTNAFTDDEIRAVLGELRSREALISTC